ncbi:MAG: hypothetical protein ONB46_17795 [candidate division KSB1 bacterium]|nr:hypothetical protein [candidate division KSB1 bacterium]MDZ7367654.1 hypothetical protein [candidate division KSB1 bacterium]
MNLSFWGLGEALDVIERRARGGAVFYCQMIARLFDFQERLS